MTHCYLIISVSFYLEHALLPEHFEHFEHVLLFEQPVSHLHDCLDVISAQVRTYFGVGEQKNIFLRARVKELVLAMFVYAFAMFWRRVGDVLTMRWLCFRDLLVLAMNEMHSRRATPQCYISSMLDAVLSNYHRSSPEEELGEVRNGGREDEGLGPRDRQRRRLWCQCACLLC